MDKIKIIESRTRAELERLFEIFMKEKEKGDIIEVKESQLIVTNNYILKIRYTKRNISDCY